MNTQLAPVQQATLVTAGEVLAVMLAEEGLPLAESTRFRRIIAGSEVNVAAGFVRLGHLAHLATVVGRDAFGDSIEAQLRAWAINAHVARSDRATGTLVRTLARHRPAEAVHLRAAAASTELAPAQIDALWPPNTSVVFVTGITCVRSASAKAAVERLVERARHDGALVVVDPNVRPSLGSPDDYRHALAGLAGNIDIAIGDAAELAVLAGTNEADAAAHLLAAGARTVVTKRGAEGAVARDASRSYAVGSAATDVVDTVGAGDAFAAGFIAGIVENRGIQAALELASVVAARVVGTAGDVEGFPWRSQIDWSQIDFASDERVRDDRAPNDRAPNDRARCDCGQSDCERCEKKEGVR
ncbi:MAG: sugar kinase [Rhodoglobus sp.]